MTLPNPHSEIEEQVIFADCFCDIFVDISVSTAFHRMVQMSFRRTVIFTWVSLLKLILDTGLLVSLTVEDSEE